MEMKPKFKLGREVATRSVSEWIDPSGDEGVRYGQVLDCLKRHVSGDWGDVCSDDAALNDEALKLGNRILSVYTVDDRVIWIITEADRSSTTILFPEEY